jgi:DNA polymerase (family 10)
MDKREIIRILEEIGTLLELQEENPFKARAYYTAVRVLSGLDAAGLQDLVRSGKLRTLKGIGVALAEKITELVTTGQLTYYEGLRQAVPAGLLEMLTIPGMGPKKVKAIHDQLGITTVGELEYACHENRLVDLPGFGRKSQENVLKAIERLKQHRGQYLCHDAFRVARSLIEGLVQCSATVRVSLVGALRRRQEIVERIDVLASTQDPGLLSVEVAQLPVVEEVLAREPGRVSLRLQAGVPAELSLVSDEAFPYAQYLLTGSQGHTAALQARAQAQGWRLDEHGLFRGNAPVVCREEAEIFTALGLPYIPPELRENTGEIEVAARGQLPLVIEERDIRGVFHVHSTWSDGMGEIREMADTAQGLGYEYLGLSDHSQSARYANGLTPERVREQHAVIDRLNEHLDGLTILKGSEVDILPDGSLDYPDDLLAQLDFVVASVHSRFGLSEAEMTARIVKAMHHPSVTMLGHPTGRLLLAREGYALDIETVLDEAIRLGVIIELNANPHRLDLDWRDLRRAYGRELMISINPDAHAPEGLMDVTYGVGSARKAWIAPRQVLNTRGVDDIRAWLSGRRHERV